MLAGDPRAIARAISLIEDEDPAAADLVRAIFGRTGRAYLIGVTGPPGAGKSTLVDRLITTLRTRDRRARRASDAPQTRDLSSSIGVIAVDPTSPFTGGAVLGDRLRMQAHAADAGVFIRSMATRGHLGGLARATGDAALVLDAAGKDIVIIETVGVGQDEVDIIRTADVSIVTLVPGTGDEVQALKAGIMEIADIFVVNKADREGADRLVSAVEANLALHTYASGEWRPPIVKTVATTGQGDAGAGRGDRAVPRALAGARRRRGARRAASTACASCVSQRFMDHLERQVLAPGELGAIVDRIAAREVDPYTAANELLATGPANHASRQVTKSSNVMKAVLDHVGIAVKISPAALAFYRDALGLEIEAPEEVASQRVRAHFLPVGEAKLELLEATAPDSPIAKYIEKRGPGLHHITLRVDDIGAALAQLKARGVAAHRRAAAARRGRRAGRVHSPVERARRAGRAEAGRQPVRQPQPRVPSSARSRRHSDSRSAISSSSRCATASSASTADRCSASCRRCSGRRRRRPTTRNRITLAMRPLIVRGARTMIIDAGLGDKESAKFHDIYGVDRARIARSSRWPRPASRPRTSTSCSPRHLHFDHAGGFTVPRRGRPDPADVSPRAVRRPARRVGGRDAPARAQSRELSGGQLRAARRRRRPAAGGRRCDDHARRAGAADRRPHACITRWC